MTSETILRELSARMDDIRARFGVRELAVFGSAARGEQGDASDVDVLVDSEGPPKFGPFMDLKFFLEEVLGVPVAL